MPPKERSGFLLKRSDHVKRWNRRYFQLKADGFLYYYREADDTEPSGALSLADIEHISMTPNVKKELSGMAFDVATPSKTFTLLATTETETQEWMGDIVDMMDFWTTGSSRPKSSLPDRVLSDIIDSLMPEDDDECQEDETFSMLGGNDDEPEKRSDTEAPTDRTESHRLPLFAVLPDKSVVTVLAKDQHLTESEIRASLPAYAAQFRGWYIEHNCTVRRLEPGCVIPDEINQCHIVRPSASLIALRFGVFEALSNFPLIASTSITVEEVLARSDVLKRAPNARYMYRIDEIDGHEVLLESHIRPFRNILGDGTEQDEAHRFTFFVTDKLRKVKKTQHRRKKSKDDAPGAPQSPPTTASSDTHSATDNTMNANPTATASTAVTPATSEDVLPDMVNPLDHLRKVTSASSSPRTTMNKPPPPPTAGGSPRALTDAERHAASQPRAGSFVMPRDENELVGVESGYYFDHERAIEDLFASVPARKAPVDEDPSPVFRSLREKALEMEASDDAPLSPATPHSTPINSPVKVRAIPASSSSLPPSASSTNTAIGTTARAPIAPITANVISNGSQSPRKSSLDVRAQSPSPPPLLLPPSPVHDTAEPFSTFSASTPLSSDAVSTPPPTTTTSSSTTTTPPPVAPSASPAPSSSGAFVVTFPSVMKVVLTQATRGGPGSKMSFIDLSGCLLHFVNGQWKLHESSEHHPPFFPDAESSIRTFDLGPDLRVIYSNDHHRWFVNRTKPSPTTIVDTPTTIAFATASTINPTIESSASASASITPAMTQQQRERILRDQQLQKWRQQQQDKAAAREKHDAEQQQQQGQRQGSSQSQSVATTLPLRVQQQQQQQHQMVQQDQHQRQTQSGVASHRTELEQLDFTQERLLFEQQQRQALQAQEDQRIALAAANAATAKTDRLENAQSDLRSALINKLGEATVALEQFFAEQLDRAGPCEDGTPFDPVLVGDDHCNPRIGSMVRGRLCSAIAGVLSDGMKTARFKGLLGPSSIWSLIEASVGMNLSMRVMGGAGELVMAEAQAARKQVMSLNQRPEMNNDPDMKFRTFVCGCLNHHHFAGWLDHFRRYPEGLFRVYNETAFMASCNREEWMRVMDLAQRIDRLQFRLFPDFEARRREEKERQHWLKVQAEHPEQFQQQQQQFQQQQQQFQQQQQHQQTEARVPEQTQEQPPQSKIALAAARFLAKSRRQSQPDSSADQSQSPSRPSSALQVLRSVSQAVQPSPGIGGMTPAGQTDSSGGGGTGKRLGGWLKRVAASVSASPQSPLAHQHIMTVPEQPNSLTAPLRSQSQLQPQQQQQQQQQQRESPRSLPPRQLFAQGRSHSTAFLATSDAAVLSALPVQQHMYEPQLEEEEEEEEEEKKKKKGMVVEQPVCVTADVDTFGMQSIEAEVVSARVTEEDNEDQKEVTETEKEKNGDDDDDGDDDDGDDDDGDEEEQQCLALRDNTPSDEMELRFQKGDLLTVMDRVDEDWYACMLGEESGLVPADAVRVLDSSPFE